ncbi:MAG TPA: hypothetical protein VK192_07135 [Sphingomicrobium sp.]|jgi:hypothetical protein|nr:hypothetical protein [Sphingomicrobium sp.]
MDDKSLNLWRQIEGFRRRSKRGLANREKSGTPPARQTITT